MSTWDDPEHLKPGRQTGRLQAWRDEDRIWVYRTRVNLMQRFSEHPGRFALGAIVLSLVLVTPLTLLSAHVGLHPLTLPGSAVTLFLGSGLAIGQTRRRRNRPAAPTSKRTTDAGS